MDIVFYFKWEISHNKALTWRQTDRHWPYLTQVPIMVTWSPISNSKPISWDNQTIRNFCCMEWANMGYLYAILCRWIYAKGKFPVHNVCSKSMICWSYSETKVEISVAWRVSGECVPDNFMLSPDVWFHTRFRSPFCISKVAASARTFAAGNGLPERGRIRPRLIHGL